MDNLSYNQKIEEVNRIKEVLRAKKWADIKADQYILVNSIKPENHIDPSIMLLSERAFTHAKLFKNYQIIPENLRTIILNEFLGMDLGNFDPYETQKKFEKIVPGLILTDIPKDQILEIQKDTFGLVNGLYNLKKIAQLKMAEDIHIDVNILARVPREEITKYLSEIQEFSENTNEILKRERELSKEEIAPAYDLIKKTGKHTEYELEKIKSSQDILTTLSIIEKLHLALEVVNFAYSKNLISKLGDNFAIGDILEEIQPNKYIPKTLPGNVPAPTTPISQALSSTSAPRPRPQTAPRPKPFIPLSPRNRASNPASSLDFGPYSDKNNKV